MHPCEKKFWLHIPHMQEIGKCILNGILNGRFTCEYLDIFHCYLLNTIRNFGIFHEVDQRNVNISVKIYDIVIIQNQANTKTVFFPINNEC